LKTSTVNRYPIYDKKPGSPIKYHPETELFYLSEKAIEWFTNDELGIILIHGQQGFGKTTYACISCAEVYGHDINNSNFFYNWEAVKKHIVWTPRQFIELCKEKPKPNDKRYMIHPNSDKKEPMVVWDDAGYWLNAMDYRDKLCVQISKYLEVARTRWGTIVFTVSDQRQILNKIRGIPHAWSIPIRKTATPKRTNPRYKWQHDLRYAHLHKSWCSEDMKRSGKKGKEGDLFYARMPPKFYKWYKPFRDSYCERAISDADLAAQEIGL
jgi:hypothetical protein